MNRLQALLDLIARMVARAPLLVLVGFFAVQALLRGLVPVAPGEMEAGEFVKAQALAWGYGPVPPLYSWLATTALRLTGGAAVALPVLKALVLVALCLLTRRLARTLGADPDQAAIAMFLPVLLPHVAFEAQLTHPRTLIALALTAASLDRLLVLVRDRRALDYLLLGALLGLGTLASHAFPLLPGLLVLALLATSRGRAALLHPWILETLAVAAALVAPHALWILTHGDGVTPLATRLREASAPMGLGIVVQALTAFGLLLPPLGLLALVYAQFREKTAAPAGEDAFAPLARRTLLVACLAGGGGLVLIGGVLDIPEHWLLPVLLPLPVLVLIPVARRVPASALGWPRLVAAILMLVVLAALPVQMRLSESGAAAWQAIQAELARAAPGTKAVLAGDHALGGRLRWSRPDMPVLDSDLPGLAVPVTGPVLLVWPDRLGETPPRALDFLAKVRIGLGTMGPVGTVAVPAWSGGARPVTLRYATFTALPD